MTSRLFISFATQERAWVRRLLARLNSQLFQIWDYSNEDDEIHGGAILADDLKRQIATCHCFVPVVTAASCRSSFVDLEVREALARRNNEHEPRVIPVVQQGLNLSDLAEPFCLLRQFRYYTFAPAESVERIVEAVCRDMGQEYRPIPNDDATFPVMTLLDDEIRNLVPRNAERDIATYHRLMRTVGDFREAFEAGRVDRAYNIITYITGICEYEFEPHSFYYTYVARAVCALLLDRLSDVAPILELLGKHPMRDEHFPALLGMVCFRRGAFNMATRHFHEAIAEAERRGHPATSALTWLLQAHVHLDEESGLGDIFERLDAAALESKRDQRKLQRLVAFADARLGSPERARLRLGKLIDSGECDAEVITCYALVLDRLGDPLGARALLERHLSMHGGLALYRQLLGSLCFRSGSPQAALDHFMELVHGFPESRQYYSDAMEVAWGMGDTGTAKALATTVLTSKRVPPPSSAIDFFIDGLANYILGYSERAKYDRERSKFHSEYADYLQSRRRAADVAQ